MNDRKLNEPETYSRTTARGVLKFIQTEKVDRRDIQKLKFKELEELLLPSKDSKKTPVTMSDKPKVNDGNSLTPQKNNITNSPASPANSHLMPSPIITRRTRTVSTSDRAMRNPLITGMVKSFSRSKGHGFITPSDGSPEIFVHISDIEGEYIPQSGDEVSYRICSIPPKFEKYQAIHVQITNLTPNVHTKWETPSYD